VGPVILGIIAIEGPKLAREGARKLGASDTVAEATGFFTAVGTGAGLGAAMGLPEGGIGAIPGAVLGGVIGGVGYLSENYELCIPFYSCD
jgi:hypothetical protein